MAQVSLNELVAQTYRGVYGTTITESFQTANKQIKSHASEKLGIAFPTDADSVFANKENVLA